MNKSSGIFELSQIQSLDLIEAKHLNKLLAEASVSLQVVCQELNVEGFN